MLFRRQIFIYSETYNKHINTICVQNAEPFHVKAEAT
jgi:hypothetical protein